MTKPISPDTRETIRQRIESGVKTLDIQKELGVTYPTVARVAKNYGLTLTRTRPVPHANDSVILRMVQEGCSRSDICRATGLRNVDPAFKRLGIEYNPEFRTQDPRFVRKVRKLIMAGKTHAEVAAKVGVSTNTIGFLSATYSMTEDYRAEKDRYIQQMTQEGLTIEEIAERLGTCYHTAMTNIRRRELQARPKNPNRKSKPRSPKAYVNKIIRF